MHQYASFHIDILQAKFASLAVGVPNLGATLRGKTVKISGVPKISRGLLR